MILSRNMLLYGTNVPPPVQVRLRAGPLSLIYEDGGLRYIRLGEREVARRIYIAVRDQHWVTVPHRITDLRLKDHADSFHITFEALHQEREIDFLWRGIITGGSDGTIRFEMNGIAHSTFLKNRIGICVLYPIHECAGQPCVIEHADGSLEDGIFTQEIAPHQPFSEI